MPKKSFLETGWWARPAIVLSPVPPAKPTLDELQAERFRLLCAVEATDKKIARIIRALRRTHQ